MQELYETQALLEQFVEAGQDPLGHQKRHWSQYCNIELSPRIFTWANI